MYIMFFIGQAEYRTTRNMGHTGQSPTWGRPAPQVRLEIQFRGL